MSEDGSTLNQRVNFSCKDEKDRRQREARSEEMIHPGANSPPGLGAAFDGGDRMYSVNGDEESGRMRSQSEISPRHRSRKFSDPVDTGVRENIFDRRELSRSNEFYLERSTSRNSPGSSSRRSQLHIRPSPRITGAGGSFYLIEAVDDNDFNIVEEAENEVEARKMINNHMFGFRMWKSPVSSRPSESEDQFNSESTYLAPSKVSTIGPSNILYTALIGWWLALIYALIGCLMYITILGHEYGRLCFVLAKYFLWPFGKYVHRVSCMTANERLSLQPTFSQHYQSINRPYSRNFQRLPSNTRSLRLSTMSSTSCTAAENKAFTQHETAMAIDRPSTTLPQVVIQASDGGDSSSESTTVSPDAAGIGSNPGASKESARADSKTSQDTELQQDTFSYSHWKKPSTYLWILLATPVLLPVHCVIMCVTWFLVVTIPVTRINFNTVTKVVFAAPKDIYVDSSDDNITDAVERDSEIVLCTRKSFNLHCLKYTVDGVNVVLFNLLAFVALSIILGFIDTEHTMVSPALKCIMGMLAILPVTYYIGMAITCISAQSSFAVGAIMNATFGSIVEVILYIIMLKEGVDKGETCYVELVKSTLTGSILCCILLVPGISMIIGGLKYRRQVFNRHSANISSSLLFVAVIGVFAPTIFSKMYGNLTCEVCQNWENGNSTFSNDTGFICSGCSTVTDGPHHDTSLFRRHVMPLLYFCAIILPLSYIIGLVFSMKTHTREIFEEFEQLQKAEGAGGHESHAQWSNLKSGIILCLSVTAISLCSDLIAANIAPLLNIGGISEYFVGVTVLSTVAMLPEVVNGVLFALQNNVNLGIEIGSAAAIQVCMVQLPIIVLADLIYPLGFGAVFNDIHLYAIIFAVIIINYVFMDGKSDYFQGSIVVFIYMLLMAMYFFTVTPDSAVCKKP